MRYCNPTLFLISVLALSSCRSVPCPRYTYSATVWQKGQQKLLTSSGGQIRTGGYLGHIFGEPVSVGEAEIPDAEIIGTLTMSNGKERQSFPIKKWSAGNKMFYAIGQPDFHDLAFALLESESKVLTQVLLKDLIGKLVID